MKKSVLLINHVFWPDPHNTARHISELAMELGIRGWKVDALISNRSYLDHKKKIKPICGVWNGVRYYRAYVPPFNQKKNLPRILTALWLIVSWITWLPRLEKYDVIIIGTNPPFAYFIIPFLRLFKRRSKLVMWAFDIYPEAIMVTGKPVWILLGFITKQISRCSYRSLDLLVDIGPCMRERYRCYKHKAKEVTLTPWSFVEPNKFAEKDKNTRNDLFGESSLGLLYTGTIGMAHEFDNFISLARELNKINAPVTLCFAGFGNKLEALKKMVNKSDTNIKFAGFVNTDKELQKRLSSPDFALISLKEDWTGISVPSKFFASIASGQPVIYSGSEDSDIGTWIRDYKIGIVLNKDNVKDVAAYLLRVSKNPEIIEKMKINAFNIYQNLYCKKVVCDAWDKELHKLLNE